MTRLPARTVLIVIALFTFASQQSAAETLGYPKATAKKPTAKTASVAEPYIAVISKIADEIGAGRIDEAVKLMVKHSRHIDPAASEEMRKMFSLIYGAAGAYDGNELVAVRRIAGRVHSAFVVSYHEKGPIVYNFRMYKYQGVWRIVNLSTSDNLDELEKLAPIEWNSP